jgi:hypothetical protein
VLNFYKEGPTKKLKLLRRIQEGAPTMAIWNDIDGTLEGVNRFYNLLNSFAIIAFAE